MTITRFGLAAATAVCFLTAAGHAQERKAHPNIVLLLADDLGWTDISTGATSMGHGNTYAQTPAIDKLAAEGLSFTNMHVCPNCAPTRAALMTGQYPVHNGVYNVASLSRGEGVLTPAKQRSEKILNESVALGETLKAAGYATCHVGKFHVSTHDDITKYDGFDFNYGGGKRGDASPHGYFAIPDGNGWGFISLGPEMNPFATPYTKEYVEKNLVPFANGNDPMTVVGTNKHLTDADADAAIDFLTKHVEGPEKDKPFFINVAYNAVHGAVKSRPDLLAKYEKIESKDPRHKRADFAGLTEGMDQASARVLKFLDDHGLTKDTVVVFMSDNGGAFGSTINAPLREVKGTFYEGGLRVPMIVRWPGVAKAGGVSGTMVNVVDLYPTFAEIAGAPLPDPKVHALDGTSIAGVLRGEAKDSKRDVTYYHFPGYLDTRAFPVSEIIKRTDGKEYKLIYSYEDKHFELYNLTDDLSEKHDLLQGQVSEGDKKLAGELRDDLSAWLAKEKPLMAKTSASGAEVPGPIAVAEALGAGNKVTRVMHGSRGKGGGESD